MSNDEGLSKFEHNGLPYTWILDRLHKVLKPETYFEIGTQTGQTLALADCASLAVDPDFIVDSNVVKKKPFCAFYQDTSDRFFKNSSPKQFFGKRVDMAFLDGMHWYEFLLRDFFQTESYCRPNSVIALHDCIPPDHYVGRRLPHDRRLVGDSRFPDWWAGDVWKSLIILREMCPDLKMHSFDAPPTGLVLITNLSPDRQNWQQQYFRLVEKFSSTDLSTYGIGRLFEEIHVQSTTVLESDDHISSLFWL